MGSHFDPIVIHVWDGELIVTMPGSSFKAVYHKPANQPQLVAKQSPSGTHEFRARALVGGLSAGAIDGVDRVMWRECLLRVISRHNCEFAPCPLYPPIADICQCSWDVR